MKIVVTGAAGAIGSHLVEALSARGHTVFGVDCLTDYYTVPKKINLRDLKKKGIVIHNVDLARGGLDKILSGTEVIYHLAAQPGIASHVPFESYLKNNVIATQRLLEAAQKLSDLKMFVNISTSSVYGSHANGSEDTSPRPTSFYGVTKLAAEQLVMACHREKKLPALSCRLFSVYGERERPEKLYSKLIKSILEGKEFPLYKGSRDHIRSYTYVGDIIEGLLLILEKKDKCIGEIINLGTNKISTTGEGIDLIEKILGKKAKIKTMPKRPGDQLETKADIKKAKKLLGYKPKVTLEEGLKRQVDWYISKIHNKI